MNSLRLKRSIPLLITTLVIVILLGLINFAYQLMTSTKEKLTAAAAETKELRQKTTLLKNNKSLAEDQITTYNQVLGQIIPEKEDFFSIIYALEKISQPTGFAITDYTITLSTGSNEKYSLGVDGVGNATDLLNFLKDYQFSGGRLITNEKIEFSSTDTDKIKLALNFYSKSVPKDTRPTTQISPQDLAFIEKIRGKISVVIKQSDAELPLDYKTKINPF